MSQAQTIGIFAVTEMDQSRVSSLFNIYIYIHIHLKGVSKHCQCCANVEVCVAFLSYEGMLLSPVAKPFAFVFVTMIFPGFLL